MFDSFSSEEKKKIKKIYIEIQRNEFIRKNFTVKLGQPHGEHYDNFSIFNENSHYTIDFSRYRNLLGLMGSNYMFTVSSDKIGQSNTNHKLYFLEDDFESRQWLGGRWGSGDKLQMKLATDHFPPNITNNIITLVEITYKLKKLTTKDFKNIWEKTNFADPDHHYFPGL